MSDAGRPQSEIPFDGGFQRGFQGGTEWLQGEGPSADVVMSSRVRLARNLFGLPFVARAKRTDREHVMLATRPAIERLRPSDAASAPTWIDLREVTPAERDLLVERHLISKQHATGRQSDGSGDENEPRAVAVDLPGERLSIMVNEEDHLRLQVMRRGLDLGGALEAIEAVDDELESGLDFAFSPRWGYLTCCPTNVGTGARLSVMLHLPGLRISGEIDKVKRAADSMSLAIRGYFGEGSEASGDFYQLSNQTTLGRSERVLHQEMEHEIIPQVVDYERLARQNLLKGSRLMIEDRCWRALGQLRTARLLTTEESMRMLSQLRLGVVTELIRDVHIDEVHRLMLLTHTAHLHRACGRTMSQEERRAARAELMRERLAPSPRAN